MSSQPMKRVAIIGAGMAGAACAARLTRAGSEILVLDKGRSPGGRLSQRRVDGAAFDHGAQFMKVRDPGFRRAIEGWAERGAAAPWDPGLDGEQLWVGTPAMNAPVKALLDGAALRTKARVTRIARGEGGWWVMTEQPEAEEPFDAVVLAIPAPQAAELLGGAGDEAARALAGALAAVEMAPCWALMAAFEEALAGPEALRPKEGAIAWAARNGGKSGRGGNLETWTVHATPEWSRAHLEGQPEAIEAELFAAFAAALPARPPAPAWLSTHRWRYAFVERALGAPFLLDAEAGLGLCGDWCLGPRVEAAWISGDALGAALAG